MERHLWSRGISKNCSNIIISNENQWNEISIAFDLRWKCVTEIGTSLQWHNVIWTDNCCMCQALCLWLALCYGLVWFGAARFYHILWGYLIGTGATVQVKQQWITWLTDGKSILVQVMAWYRHPTSYYLSQCCHMTSLGHNELTYVKIL